MKQKEMRKKIEKALKYIDIREYEILRDPPETVDIQGQQFSRQSGYVQIKITGYVKLS